MSSRDYSILSLQDLQNGVKDAIHLSFPEYIWVHAELSEVNVNRNGHCYIELIEKKDDQIIAKVRATIWSFTFRMLKPYFESATGYEFKSGIKVSLKAVVEFHEVYGLSLNVKDIDPNYTIGDAEIQKRKILNQLESDGVLEMNAELDLPLVTQNIAVISSATAAGYGDWKNQIEQNTEGYKINYKFFEAQMQGVDTGKSIILALDQIYQEENNFDIVVIIRGGGSKTDLSGFDNYELAANIAQFPLPIITGIGHERDESIADIVAHKALKTPTAVADFLIDILVNFEYRIDRTSSDILSYANNVLEDHRHDLEIAVQNLHQITKYNLQKNQDILFRSTKQLLRETHNISILSSERLRNLSDKISYESKRIFRRQNEGIEEKQTKLRLRTAPIILKQIKRLEYLEQLNNAFDPKQVLERGFSMIEQDNKIITSIVEMDKKKSVKIIMKDGTIDR